MADKSQDELLQAPDLGLLKKWFLDSEDASMESRKLSERDRDYYDGTQWTAEELAELQRRGQPPTVVNRIAPKVDFILGEERKSRTRPRAWPRNAVVDEGGAAAVTDAVRYVLDYSDAQFEYSAAFSELLIEGIGAVELVVKQAQAKNDHDICLRHVPWDRVFFDPRSRRHDFSDAKYVGVVQWMDYQDALELFPGSKERIDATLSTDVGNTSNTYDDRPVRSTWADGQNGRNRVRIIQTYYRIGHWDAHPAWMQVTFCGGGILVDHQPSWLQNEYGAPVCPVLLQSAKIDRDNDRYGVVRNLVPLQDEINKRRSKALHLLNVRQTIGEQGAVDVPTAKAQMSRPDGHVEVAPGMRFEVVPQGEFMDGQLILLQEAKSEMDMVGAAAALSGKEPRGQSGIALQTRQQGGMLELEVIRDNFRSLRLRSYRAIWYAIKQFWTAEKWVRVTDDEANLRYVGLNKPLTNAELLAQQGVEIPPPELLDPGIAQMLSQPSGQVQNDVKYLDVDIVIEESVDSTVLQQEEFAVIANMVSSGLPIPPDIVIEASSLRNKQQILDRMRGQNLTPEQQQQQAQQAQMQQASLQADLRAKHAKADKDEAQASLYEAQAVNPSMETAHDRGLKVAEAQAKLLKALQQPAQPKRS